MRERLVARAFLANDASEWIEVEAPMTAEIIGTIPRGRKADVLGAVEAARVAQRQWAQLCLRDRQAVLLRFHDLVLERQEEVLDLLQLETGKARMHAFEEVLDTAMTARYYGHTAGKYLKPKRRHGALPLLTQAWELHHPRGVIGFMVPWNYPLSLGITDALPALVAGNGAVIKPDEQTPYSVLWAVELLEEAGLPAGLCQVVTGEGAELGGFITDSVDFVMFTGSTRVGRIVATQAAGRLIEYSMELGGKNAMIVRHDADIEQTAIRGTRAAFSNSGQLCISMERAYVDHAIYDDFVAAFAAATASIKLGAALDYSAEMGSLISARQLATVQEHVDDAIGKGAQVLAGGQSRPDLGPYFYEPTLLEGVTPEMTIYANETFGPVVSIYQVGSDEEAIARANESDYGLNFSIWTRDTNRGREIAAQLQAGTVCINEGYASGWGSTDVPMGGFKDSGTGRRHGEHGITKYCESQSVSVQRVLPLSAPPGMSGDFYSKAMTTGLSVLKRLPGMRW